MPEILLLSSPSTALGTVLASLATDGFRQGIRSHGYRINEYAFLLHHNRGSVRIGMRHLTKGNTSSLLCLCGISVSLAFYVLYLRFYPGLYHSAFLRRVIKRLLQTRAQKQATSIISISRKQCNPQHTASFCSDTYNNSDDDNNNTSDAGVCSIGSVDSSKQDGVIFGEHHQLSTLATPSPPSSPSPSPAAAAAEPRMRHRITRRRRTLSESPGVVARLDDFICLIPEIVDRPRHVQRTKNVLDWLAQIDLDPDSVTSLFDEDFPLDDVEAPLRRSQLHSLESIASASGSGCECVRYSRDDWCQECLSSDCGRPSGRRSHSTQMDVQKKDLNQGLSVLSPEGEGVESQRRMSAAYGALGAGVEAEGKRSAYNCSVVLVPTLDGKSQERGSRDVNDNVLVGELDSAKKPVFYFEEDELDNASDKDVPLQEAHFEESPKEQKHSPDTLLKQGHHTGATVIVGSPSGGAGYDWLRMRILGADRKRRISTGSGLSAKFLASRGLLRNHHSFTSAISGASSEYTYRESLVSKGFSIDCGEDLNALVFQGEDLLEAAEFSRYTLTSIDQLHEELEVIQRNISYINDKVESLQSRDDFPDFAARYGYGIEESIGNDPIFLEAAAFESGMRRKRSRSLSLMPGDTTQMTTYREIEDVPPGPVVALADEFVWDYGSDLVLNPVYSHHRSLTGLTRAGEGQDLISNQLRTGRSRSDELELTFRRELSADDLTVVKSDDVIDDEPDVTYFDRLSDGQNDDDGACDEYFDDDYDMLSHLHR